jgi:hypothetical protein
MKSRLTKALQIEFSLDKIRLKLCSGKIFFIHLNFLISYDYNLKTKETLMPELCQSKYV